jgi:hypothetical protein
MAMGKNGFLGSFLLFAFLPLLLPWECARGEVVRVVVDRREDILGGREWGDRGPYEKLVGRIYFAFDPANPHNAQIVDLKLAPRNAAGMVEAWTDFMVLQPKNSARRRGIAWVEVSNRGGKATLRYFNRAAGSTDPVSEADFGDGLFLAEGLTLIWLGWQWDVPDQAGLLRLHVATAVGPEGSLEGFVRADWTVDEDSDVLLLGHRSHRPYPPVSADHPGHMLTVRDGRLAPRLVIPVTSGGSFRRRRGESQVTGKESPWKVASGREGSMSWSTSPEIRGLRAWGWQQSGTCFPMPSTVWTASSR